MHAVQTIRPQDRLSLVTGASIAALIHAVWPSAAQAKTPTLDETMNSWHAQGSAHFVLVDDEVRAHTLLFRREIFTSRGPLLVGALAAVCVHPDYRGRGWGAAVVRAAFGFLPEMGVEVALFQTGVPKFYEKLGSHMVNNRFFNGTDSGNPFWDSYVMIYPASCHWPDGPIDLNGAGY